MKKNSHAPEIVTHITEDHAKENIFGMDSNRSSTGHPKVKEGCYANAEGKSEE